MDTCEPMPLSRRLASLPSELLVAIVAQLSNRDRKSLRLTCKAFGESVLLRIDRVFLSTNPLNIQVFRAIAGHEIYRRSVVELIWDDAQLGLPDVPPAYKCECRRGLLEMHFRDWFDEMCARNVEQTRVRKRNDVDRPDHIARSEWMAAQPPCEVMWEHYKELLIQQAEVILAEDDAFALQYGLERFPSLRKITVTPATHGVPFTPLYQTPMIRALPYGFNYPIPRGWPAAEAYDRLRIPQWKGDSDEVLLHRSRWRGYRIVTQTLAHVDHKISELVIDVSLLNTGLNAHIFDQPCDELDNLIAILCNLGFRRLDLALLIDRQDEIGWPAFRNGRLYRALSLPSALEHISLRTNTHYDPDSDDWAAGTEHFIGLRNIFPIHEWPKLKHFGLSGFIVQLDDLMSLLAALPETIRSIELSFLIFQKDYGTHRKLLRSIRDTLGWQGRAISERPKLSMAWNQSSPVPREGRAIWLDNQVNQYIYSEGKNPFTEACPDHIEYGIGIEKDLFEPAHERPHVGLVELAEMGICRRN